MKFLLFLLFPLTAFATSGVLDLGANIFNGVLPGGPYLPLSGGTMSGGINMGAYNAYINQVNVPLGPALSTSGISQSFAGSCTTGVPLYYKFTQVIGGLESAASTQFSYTPTGSFHGWGTSLVTGSDQGVGANTFNVYKSLVNGVFGATSLLQTITSASTPYSFFDNCTISLTAGTPPSVDLTIGSYYGKNANVNGIFNVGGNVNLGGALNIKNPSAQINIQTQSGSGNLYHVSTIDTSYGIYRDDGWDGAAQNFFSGSPGSSKYQGGLAFGGGNAITLFGSDGSGSQVPTLVTSYGNTSTFQGPLATLNNTLDDGSGNMNVSQSISVPFVYISGSAYIQTELNTDTITDYAGNVGIDMATKVLMENGNESVNWVNRYLVDSASNQALNWGTRTLKDASSITVVDWQNSKLKTGANDSMNWSSRNLYDASSLQSIDYGNRQLNDSSGTVQLSWSTTGLSAGGGGFLVGTTGITTAKAIKNTATQTTVNCSTSGNAVFSQPEQGSSYKVVIIKFAACIGTASYTFPTAFGVQPSVIATNDIAAGIITARSTTAITATGATTTGYLTLIGY